MSLFNRVWRALMAPLFVTYLLTDPKDARLFAIFAHPFNIVLLVGLFVVLLSQQYDEQKTSEQYEKRIAALEKISGGAGTLPKEP